MSLRTASIQLAHSANPALRGHLLRVLTADAPTGEEEPKAKGHGGPPPMWKEFLEAQYEGGKRKVPNTNSDTRQQHPQVAVSTLLKSDKGFYKKVYKEYLEWVSKQKKDTKDGPKTAPKKEDEKSDSKTKKKPKPATKDEAASAIAEFQKQITAVNAIKFLSPEGKTILKEYLDLRGEIWHGDEKTYDYAEAIGKLKKLAPAFGKAFAEAKKKKEEAPKKEPKKEAPKESKKFPSIKLRKDRFDDVTLQGSHTWSESIPPGHAVKNVINAFAGKGKSLKVHDIADMIGATGLKGITVSTLATYDGLEMTVEGPHIEYMARVLRVDEKGEKYIYNDTLKLKSSAPEGLGTKLLAGEVAQARAAGIKTIKCNAYRDRSRPEWIGYKVWPKMGYDGPVPFESNDYGSACPPLPKALQDKVKKAGFRDPLMVSHLYQVEGGMDWWEKNGESFHATLDLTDDSYSMRVLSHYIDKKAQKAKQDPEEWVRIAAARIAAFLLAAAKKDDSKKVPKKVDEKHKKEHENLDLGEDDHKILDAYWEKVVSDRKAKHPY